MNLSTEVKSHIILFRDKSELFITEAQANAIFQQSAGVVKGIRINNNYYSFADMTKIMATSDYYDQYPDKIPVERTALEIDASIPYKSVEAQIFSSSARLDEAKKGIQKFITESEFRGENPTYAKARLKEWQENKPKSGNASEASYYQKVVDKYKDVERTESEEAHYQHAFKKLNEVKAFV